MALPSTIKDLAPGGLLTGPGNDVIPVPIDRLQGETADDYKAYPGAFVLTGANGVYGRSLYLRYTYKVQQTFVNEVRCFPIGEWTEKPTVSSEPRSLQCDNVMIITDVNSCRT